MGSVEISRMIFHFKTSIILKSTRLHSSRMRTACALTVSPSMLCARGCVKSAPGGCVCSGGVCSHREVSAPRGVCSRGWGCVCSQGAGMSVFGGVCCQRGSAPGGVSARGSAPGGVCSPEGVCLGGVYSGGCLLWGVSTLDVCTWSRGCLLQGIVPGQVLPPLWTDTRL